MNDSLKVVFCFDMVGVFVAESQCTFIMFDTVFCGV